MTLLRIALIIHKIHRRQFKKILITKIGIVFSRCTSKIIYDVTVLQFCPIVKIVEEFKKYSHS